MSGGTGGVKALDAAGVDLSLALSYSTKPGRAARYTSIPYTLGRSTVLLVGRKVPNGRWVDPPTEPQVRGVNRNSWKRFDELQRENHPRTSSIEESICGITPLKR